MTNEELKKEVKKIVKKSGNGSVYASQKNLENNEIIIRFGITNEEWEKRFGEECDYDAIADMKAFEEKHLAEIEALGCVGTEEITSDGRVNIRLHIGETKKAEKAEPVEETENEVPALTLNDLRGILYSNRGNVQFAIIWDSKTGRDIENGCTIEYAIKNYGKRVVTRIEASENNLVITF